MNNDHSKKDLSDLEKAINYRFSNESLINEALTHPSLKQKSKSNPHYERLELLGDSLLGFLITEIIFHKFPKYNEGKLAKIKAHLVSHDVLYKVAIKLGIGKHLIMTPGEEKSGGRENSNNMENALEALIAAIYLDSNLDTAKNIVRNMWNLHTKNIDLADIDPKSFLQELAHDKLNSVPSYSVTKKTGPVHAPTFNVTVKTKNHSAESEGKSIKEAEKNAARNLIKKLKIL